ncbi:MAG: hypothetical protein NVS1B2_13790 [Vulcanimicrobiaceae bacterium]
MRLTSVLTVLWIQYPIVWLVGSEGFRTLPAGPETLWYSALDVVAKVVFGFLSLATVAKLTPAIEEGGTIVTSVGERRIRSAAQEATRGAARRAPPVGTVAVARERSRACRCW